MANKLVYRSCEPCREGGLSLKGEAILQHLGDLGGGWAVIEDHHLEKVYKFKNFRQALAFTNAVGQIAEQESHHPEITLTWGVVTLRIWTHKVDGLMENDFILAAKADAAFESIPQPVLVPHSNSPS
jgi:4a-hydroxytetrahydrobiopterin dehydratase